MYLPKGELSRAVLIGTSDFQNPDLPQLPAVNANLFALFRALTDPETGILPEQNCEIVQSPDSPDSFMRRLRRSANEAEDLLLVYYAGHGLRHQRRDDLYLTVCQTNPDGLDGTAVEYEWVRDVIADSPAKARLLILDCCYSGLAVDRMSGTAIDVRELAVSGTSVMASSPKNKQSHSPTGDRHTAFTGELLKLLADGSPVADRPLTVQNAYQSIKAGLAKRSFPLPTLRSDDTSGQMLLRRQPKPPKPVAPPVQVRPVAQPAPPSQVEPPARPSPVDKPVVPSQAEQTVRTAPVRPPPMPPTAWPGVESGPRSFTPAPPTPARRSGNVLMSAALAVGIGAIWCLATICLGFVLGGLVGAGFGPAGTTSSDLKFSLGGFFIAAIPTWVLAVQWRRRRRLLPTGSSIFELLPAFSKVRTPVLVVFVAICASLAVSAFVAGPSTTDTRSTDKKSTYSGLALDAGTGIVLLEWGLIFGQAVVRRRKLDHKASAGDQRQVEGGE
jgi:hypothetical protein